MSKVKIYKVKMVSGEEWLMSGDFAQSASPLMACFDATDAGSPLADAYDDDCNMVGDWWQGTDYQVADVQHDAAKLVYDYFHGEWLGDDIHPSHSSKDDVVDEINEVNEEL